MTSNRLLHWFIWPSLQLFMLLHQLRVPKKDWTQSDVEGLVAKSFFFSVVLTVAVVSLLVKYLLR